jgi:hypothetical protein
MTDPTSLIALAGFGLAGLALASAAGLRVWNGWLELKRAELEARPGASPTSAGSRIELADLKERLRKLEAIANGSEA